MWTMQAKKKKKNRNKTLKILLTLLPFFVLKEASIRGRESWKVFIETNEHGFIAVGLRQKQGSLFNIKSQGSPEYVGSCGNWETYLECATYVSNFILNM